MNVQTAIRLYSSLKIFFWLKIYPYHTSLITYLSSKRENCVVYVWYTEKPLDHVCETRIVFFLKVRKQLKLKSRRIKASANSQFRPRGVPGVGWKPSVWLYSDFHRRLFSHRKYSYHCLFFRLLHSLIIFRF